MPVCFSFPFAATYAIEYGCEMIDSGSDVVRTVYLVRIILPTCTVKMNGKGTYSPVEESLLLEMSTLKFTGTFRCRISKRVFYCFIY